MTGCDFSDDKLIVINASRDSIAFIIPAEPNYFPTSDNLEESRLNKRLNDSLLMTIAKYDPKEESFGGVHFLKGDSTKHILAFNSRWEQIVSSTSKKELKIIFFPAHIMTSGKFTWKEIYDKNMFKEKTLKIEELDDLNWKVVYDN